MIPREAVPSSQGIYTPATDTGTPSRSVPASAPGGSLRSGGGGGFTGPGPQPSRSRSGPGPHSFHGRCVHAGPSADVVGGVSGAGRHGRSSRGADVAAPPTHRTPVCHAGGALPASPGAGAAAP